MEMNLNWLTQLAQAKELYWRDPAEVSRYAAVSTENGHKCQMCFCCACAEIFKNWGQMPLEADEIPY